MRWVLTYLTFPAILGGSLGLAAWLLHRGSSVEAAVALGQAVGILATALAERLHPYRRDWLRSQGDVRVDTVHAVVNLGVTTGVTLGLRALLAGRAHALAAWAGGALWSDDLPLGLQLALALLLAELGGYWVHRLEHELPWLWPIHAAHHSPRRLYWLNAARFHPLDLALQQVAALAPLVLLGAPPAVIALTSVFTAVHGMLQHSNIDVRLGPLNWVFSMAELHRWHHSQTLAEANTNYGSDLIVWDVVFGTRFLPEDRPPPADIGIAAAPRFPRDYAGQLLSPFRYRRIEAETAHE